MTGTTSANRAEHALVARVLLDSTLPQLDRLLDYAVPEELVSAVLPGVRVTVPLKSAGRTSSGYVVAVDVHGEYRGTLSAIESVVSPVKVLTPEVWALARRVADRAAGGANDVLRLAIPSRQVRVEKAWMTAREAVPSPDAREPVHPAAISGYETGRLEHAVRGHERIALRAIPSVTELPGGAWVGSWALTLAQCALTAVAEGRSAILVVPDYRDQQQLEAALASLAPADTVLRFDARQSNPDRYRSFLAALEPVPRIVVGNRSAVYAPVNRLGLLAVWDDGDPLHAEPLSPYVHARDAALVRQEQSGCALIVAAHTRSVEVQRLVELGWLADVAPAPVISPRVVVTAAQSSTDPAVSDARIPSSAWRAAKDALEHGPVLVQVARPGYAPLVACSTCGQPGRCPRCDGKLGITAAGTPPACTVCGAVAAGWSCPNCAGTHLRLVTRGAGRTAEELGRAFPRTRVIIADGEHPITSVGAERALIVATRGAEPIAAGGYRAVLLLDGERMLLREQLQVGDDCLRWWSNAAALAAQGSPVFLVGVGGPLGQAMATWRQDGYASAELMDRRELRFPPAVRVATVTGALAAVQSAVEAVGEDDLIDVLGPAPVGEGLVRAVVRFEYAAGQRVADALRAAVVRNATARRRRPAGEGRYRPAPTLKVRFDDPEIL